MKTVNNEYFLLTARVVLGIVFIFAGIEKIADPSSFSVAIDNYRLFPDFMINSIAVVLPWVELICGLLLFFGIAVRENAAVMNLLLIFFIFIVIIALIRGLNIECGCFGTAVAEKVGIKKIIENIILLSGSIFLQKFNSSKMVF